MLTESFENAFAVPEGLLENSPMFQHWEPGRKHHLVPKGLFDCLAVPKRPFENAFGVPSLAVPKSSLENTLGVPEGLLENSPMFQHWEPGRKHHSVPKGLFDCLAVPKRPHENAFGVPSLAVPKRSLKNALGVPEGLFENSPRF